MYKDSLNGIWHPFPWACSVYAHSVCTHTPPLKISKPARTSFLSHQDSGTKFPQACSSFGLELAQDSPGPTCVLLSASPPTGLSC